MSADADLIPAQRIESSSTNKQHVPFADNTCEWVKLQLTTVSLSQLKSSNFNVGPERAFPPSPKLRVPNLVTSLHSQPLPGSCYNRLHNWFRPKNCVHRPPLQPILAPAPLARLSFHAAGHQLRGTWVGYLMKSDSSGTTKKFTTLS